MGLHNPIVITLNTMRDDESSVFGSSLSVCVCFSPSAGTALETLKGSVVNIVRKSYQLKETGILSQGLLKNSNSCEATCQGTAQEFAECPLSVCDVQKVDLHIPFMIPGYLTYLGSSSNIVRWTHISCHVL